MGTARIDTVDLLRELVLLIGSYVSTIIPIRFNTRNGKGWSDLMQR